MRRSVSPEKPDATFAGYALWNYLSFPFFLDEPGVVVTETGAREALSLDAVFDPSFPTHSATQSFRRLVENTTTDATSNARINFNNIGRSAPSPGVTFIASGPWRQRRAGAVRHASS